MNKNIITRISTLALAGAMMVTSMTGCGNGKKKNLSTPPASVVGETTTAITTTVTEETSETTTVATTPIEILTFDEEEYDETKEDWYIAGLVDIHATAMKEGYYAVHLLFGSDDAVKAFENGTLDGINSGYDMVWQFGADEHYLRYFDTDEIFVSRYEENGELIKPDDLEKKLYYGEVDMSKPLYSAISADGLEINSKSDRYNPFENGSAEYKENTICIIWQKSAGTFDGAKAFYYPLMESASHYMETIYKNALASNVLGNGYNNNQISKDDSGKTNSVYKISSTSSADERKDAVKFTVEETTPEVTETEAVTTTVAETVTTIENNKEPETTMKGETVDINSVAGMEGFLDRGSNEPVTRE